jgi:streptogramin lyase
VTKIFAQAENCLDDNGTPDIQTSTGKFDVLAWDEEECVAWYTDYAVTSERAVAWTAGDLNEQTCEYSDPKVWIGMTTNGSDIRVLKLNGDTGVEEEAVNVLGTTTGFASRSPYGGAVDADGDVWMVNAYCNSSLFEVHEEDMSYEVHAMPNTVCAYGVAVDSGGYVWVGGYQTWTGRYDPVNDTWDEVQAQGLGIQEDGSGRLWLGAYGQDGVYEINADTLVVDSYTPLPTITGQSKGVSIDYDGYVWVVSDSGNNVVRMDPDTFETDTYTGLDSPYSYSDMTGWGLTNAIVPQ